MKKLLLALTCIAICCGCGVFLRGKVPNNAHVVSTNPDYLITEVPKFIVSTNPYYLIPEVSNVRILDMNPDYVIDGDDFSIEIGDRDDRDYRIWLMIDTLSTTVELLLENHISRLDDADEVELELLRECLEQLRSSAERTHK